MRCDVLAAVAALFLIFPQAGPEKTSREKILDSEKEWRQNYDDFKAEPELLELLKTRLDDHTRIDVYLGLWCPDSRKHVPPFIRIVDDTKSAATVNYYTVQRKPSKDIKYYVEEFQVERVPTFIFYRDDKEIGRIIENPKVTLIDDLIQIAMGTQ
jgi:thiol-disulfide isomerase/thioredoxin